MERASIFIKENLRLLLGVAVVGLVTILFITLLVNRKTTKVLVNDQTIKVSVAKNDRDRQIGLSGKKSLPPNQGMLFVFDNANYYSFWMKKMKFQIDIIYITGDRVVTVIENAKPPSSSAEILEIYQPEEKSDKVLEINAGLAQKYNIKKGTIIKVQNL